MELYAPSATVANPALTAARKSFPRIPSSWSPPVALAALVCAVSTQALATYEPPVTLLQDFEYEHEEEEAGE